MVGPQNNASLSLYWSVLLWCLILNGEDLSLDTITQQKQSSLTGQLACISATFDVKYMLRLFRG